MNKSKSKPRILKKAVPAPKQKAEVRRQNFDEVILGYTEKQAIEEASRRLQCASPQCVSGCPVEIPISDFIKLLRERQYEEAVMKLKEKTLYLQYVDVFVPKRNSVKNFASWERSEMQ